MKRDIRTNNLCRLSLLAIIAFAMAGCSTIHNSISPDKLQSELRSSVKAPLELSGVESQICSVHPIQAQPKLVRIPEP